MKQFARALALSIVVSIVGLPIAVAVANPVEDTADAVSAAALAQDHAPGTDAPALDPEIAVIMQALSKAFTADGKVNWIVAAPFIVWAVVFAVRKWVAALIPGKVGEWLRSRIGGLVLTAVTSLTLAILKLVLGGGALSAATVVAFLLNWGYGFFTSIGLHEGPKNLAQHLAAKAEAQETAAQTITRVSGAGPQP